jgi:hypothetical protein
MPEHVVEVVGVYDADGGLVGEVTYAVGHLLGRSECALCDITHDSLRRRPEWDAMVAGLPVPVRLVHRNEVNEAERAASHVSGLPAVLGRRSDGSHTVLLGPTGLQAVEGSVPRFEEALRAALAVEGVGPGGGRTEG